jgi:hypothetical protein
MKKFALYGLFVAGAVSIAVPAYAAPCARVFEHINHGGEVKHISSGDNVSYVGDLWNDKISSVIVEPGCALNVWEHADYRGKNKTYGGSLPFVGEDFNDIISSYTCTCGGH